MLWKGIKPTNQGCSFAVIFGKVLRSHGPRTGSQGPGVGPRLLVASRGLTWQVAKAGAGGGSEPGPRERPRPCWVLGGARVLLCLAVAVWILPKVQLYITVCELRFCMRQWRGAVASKDPAQEEGCADIVQVQYGGTTARSNLFCTSIRIRKRIGSIFWSYVLFGLFYFGLVN